MSHSCYRCCCLLFCLCASSESGGAGGGGVGRRSLRAANTVDARKSESGIRPRVRADHMSGKRRHRAGPALLRDSRRQSAGCWRAFGRPGGRSRRSTDERPERLLGRMSVKHPAESKSGSAIALPALEHHLTLGKARERERGSGRKTALDRNSSSRRGENKT